MFEADGVLQPLFAIVCGPTTSSIYLFTQIRLTCTCSNELIAPMGLFSFTGLANDSNRPVSSEDGREASASSVVDTSRFRNTHVHLENCCQCVLIVQSALTAEIILTAMNQTADGHLRELQNVLLFYEGTINQCDF